MNNLAQVYERLGRRDDAVALHRRAIAIDEKTPGGEQGLAIALNNLAVVDLKIGRQAEAEQLTKRALAIQQKARFPDGLVAPEPQQSRGGVSAIGPCRGRRAASQTRHRDQGAAARPGSSRGRLPPHPLANAYVNLGRYQEAEPLYMRALAIRERVFGPDHMDVASVINYLARLQFLMGRTAKSINSSRKAVRLVVNRLTRDAGSRSAPEIASLRD